LKRPVFSAMVAHGTVHTIEVTFAAVLVYVGQEFNIGLTALGSLATAGTVLFGGTAIVAGFLSDRYGEKKVISRALLAASACAVLVAFSPNLYVLSISLLLLGAFIGLYHPPGTAMVAIMAENRGSGLAKHGVAGNIGLALSPAIAVFIASTLGWRFSYIVVALIGIVAYVIFQKYAPSSEEIIQKQKSLGIYQEKKNQKEETFFNLESIQKTWQAWSEKRLILIYITILANGFIYRGALTFFALHISNQLGIKIFSYDSSVIAGSLTTLLLLTGILGQFFGGFLADKMNTAAAALLFNIILVPSCLIIGYFSGWTLIIFIAIFVIFNWGQQPIANSLMASFAPQGAIGKAFGLQFFLGFGIASVAGAICGLVAEIFGTYAVFYLLAGMASLSTLAFYFIWRIDISSRKHLEK
jgi:MFS transporter, FSR family, fosmidomycin resistance protein